MGEDEENVGDGEDGEMEEEEEDEEEIIWDAKIHMHQLLEYMIRSEPRELLNFSSVTGRRNCEFSFLLFSSFISFAETPRFWYIIIIIIIIIRKYRAPLLTHLIHVSYRHRRFNSHRRRTIE